MDLVSGILGKPTKKDDGVIPKDATRIAHTGIPTGAVDKPQSSEAERKQGSLPEPLIPTVVALVAPDCTPGAEAPLSPTQVPAPTAAAPAERAHTHFSSTKAPESSVPASLPGIPSPSEVVAMESQPAANHAAIMEGAGVAAATALTAGSGMPEHKPGAGKSMDVLRRFGGPKGGKL